MSGEPGRSRLWTAHALLLAGWAIFFAALSVLAGLWRTGEKAINPINAAIVTGELLAGFAAVAVLTSAVVAVRPSAGARWVVAVHALVAAAIGVAALALLSFARA